MALKEMSAQMIPHFSERGLLTTGMYANVPLGIHWIFSLLLPLQLLTDEQT